MYAVTAWMVQPLTRLLVGTKMENLQKTIQNQTKNKNNEQQSAQKNTNKEKLTDHLQTENFRKSLIILRTIERNQKKGITVNKADIKTCRAQSIIEKYLQSKKLPVDMEKYFKILTKANRRPPRNADVKELLKDMNCLSLVNCLLDRKRPIKKVHWPMIDFHIKFALETGTNTNIPEYELAGIYSGFLLIKCDSKSSKQTFRRYLANIRFIIPEVHLTTIPATEIYSVCKKLASLRAQRKSQQETSDALATKKEEKAEHQGFQLSINYSATNSNESKVDQKLLDLNEHMMPTTTPTTTSNDLNNFKVENLSQPDDEMYYKRAQTVFFELENRDNLTRSQRKMKNKAHHDILSYEKAHGISSKARTAVPQHTDLKPAKQRLQGRAMNLTNEFASNEMPQVPMTSNMGHSWSDEAAGNFGVQSFSDSGHFMGSNHMPNETSYRKFNDAGDDFGQSSYFDHEQMLPRPSNMPNTSSYPNFGDSRHATEDNFGLNYYTRRNPPKESSYFDYEQTAPMNSNKPNSYDEADVNFRSNYPRSPRPANKRPYYESEMGRIPDLPPFYDQNENSPSQFTSTNRSGPESRRQTTNITDREESFNFRNPPANSSNFGSSSSFQPACQTFWRQNSPRLEGFRETTENPHEGEYDPTSGGNYQSYSKQYKKSIGEFSSAANSDHFNATTNDDNFNEWTKRMLERRIFEQINSFDDETPTIRPTTSQKEVTTFATKRPAPLTSSSYIEQLKRRLDILQKSEQHQPPAGVINLSDDDSDDVIEIKSTADENTKNEYSKALRYLNKMKLFHPDSLSDAEKLQYKICQHKVKKYDAMHASKEANTTSKRSSEQVRSSRAAKQSRWSSPSTQHSNSTRQQQQLKQQQANSSASWANNATTTASSTATRFGKDSDNRQRGFVTQETTANTTHWDDLAPSSPKPDLQIAIIDRNQEDLKISKDDWLKLEKNLLQQLVREMEQTNNQNIGMFDGMYWRYGIKVIQCENLMSLNFIKRFINSQDIFWPNRQYEVIPASELPRRSIVKVWIPPTTIHDMAIMKILKAQNSMFYSIDWTLINSRERNNNTGRDLYISISPTSLLRLRKKNGDIRFGINRLKMILPD